jgi:hypothetical protein
LGLLLKACRLYDLAVAESINIALAINGADLIQDCTHVSAGIKIQIHVEFILIINSLYSSEMITVKSDMSKFSHLSYDL